MAIQLNLPSDVISPEDLRSIALEVRQYAKWYSQYSVKTKVTTAKSAPPPPVSAVASNLIDEWANNHPSQKTLDELIASLESLASDSPRVTITLAAPAPASLKTTLVEWCRQNIADNILVSFKYNSTLLGGMVVQHGSHVYDWSFRRQILAAAPKFPEVLRRV